MLLGALASVIESKRVSNAINLFSMAAILSSFIGVGLGVFDYLADLFKFDNSRAGRAKSWGVTFLPPLLLSLLFPFGFVVAIGASAGGLDALERLFEVSDTHRLLKLPLHINDPAFAAAVAEQLRAVV